MFTCDGLLELHKRAHQSFEALTGWGGQSGEHQNDRDISKPRHLIEELRDYNSKSGQ